MNTVQKCVCCLRSINTFGCTMEIRDMGSRNITLLYSAIRGADTPPVHHARLVGSGPRNGLSFLSCAANATFARGDFDD